MTLLEWENINGKPTRHKARQWDRGRIFILCWGGRKFTLVVSPWRWHVKAVSVLLKGAHNEDGKRICLHSEMRWIKLNVKYSLTFHRAKEQREPWWWRNQHCAASTLEWWRQDEATNSSMVRGSWWTSERCIVMAASFMCVHEES